MKFPPGERVALDTMILVYFAEQHREFYEPVRRVMEQIEKGDLTGVVSTLAFAELLVPLRRAGRDRSARKVVGSFESFPNLEILPVSLDVCFEAARQRGEHGVRTPDAIHFATAVVGGADHFLTNDRRLQKLGTSAISVQLVGS